MVLGGEKEGGGTNLVLQILLDSVLSSKALCSVCL